MRSINPYRDFGLANALVPGSNLGQIIYLDGCGGSDNNSGLTPDEPKLTMTAALALATNDKNDTIVVLDYWQPAGETWPVNVNKSKVRIIGSPSGAAHRPWACMSASGNTACLSISANDVYIQDLYFDAGAAHGGIEFSGGVCRVGIHRCYFGTGAYGIYDASGGVGFSLEITDCFFCQALTAQSIYINDDPAFFRIVGNVFDQPQNIAIEVTAGGGGEIRNNVISLSGNVAGRAITLGASVYRCIVDGNHANYGDGEMGLIPYTDNAAAGQNHWLLNYKGLTGTMPN